MIPELNAEEMRLEAKLGDCTRLVTHEPTGATYIEKRPRMLLSTRQQVVDEARAIDNIHEHYRANIVGTDNPVVFAPGITPVAGLDEDYGYMYLPFYSLRTLDQDLARPFTAVAQMLVDGADALGIVHTADKVHYDVKPQNLLDLHCAVPGPYELPRSSTLLIDFGISNGRDVIIDKPIGSPNYASPQQLFGNLPDTRSDVFGLAATGYEMLTGQAPYTSSELDDSEWRQIRCEMIQNGELEWSLLRHYRGAVPRGVKDVITQALSYDPDDRPSLLDFRNGLARAVDIPETPGWRHFARTAR